MMQSYFSDFSSLFPPMMMGKDNVYSSEEERSYRQQRATHLSNYGVAMIEKGQHGEAIDALSHALKMCRQNMDEAEDFRVSMSTSFDACMEASRKATVPNFDACLSRGERYFYQQAIRIPLTIGSSYRACVMVSTMVTFNLALANQLASVKKVAEPAEAQAMLRKAVKLYELAFSMQQEEQFDGNTLFTLATVNNLGLIHSQLNDRMAANKCFEYLLSTLMYLNNTTAGGCPPSGKELFDGFLRNASSLIQKSASAPAA